MVRLSGFSQNSARPASSTRRAERAPAVPGFRRWVRLRTGGGVERLDAPADGAVPLLDL